MEAKKCDRCKKFYTIETEKSKSSSYVLYPFNGIPARPDVYEIVLAKGDLCAECTMALMRWLKNEDNNNDVSASEIEAVIATAAKAHKEMCSTEYDYGFQYGLEHSLYLLKRVIEDKEEN